MAQSRSQTIPRDQFLTMSANLLFRVFLDASRTDAKKVYKEMAEGRTVHLTDVQMEDKSTVRFEVALDHSELSGRLNFGAFRASVATLVNNLGEALRQEEKQITVFSAENNPEVNIFGVTAVTHEAEETRVMVLGADSGGGRPAVQLRLMYLDPAQFQLAADEPGSAV